MESSNSLTERPHAELGSSSAHIYIPCSGSVFLKRKIVPTPPGPPAIEGTAAHEVAEIALHDWLQYRLEGTDANIRLQFLTNADDEMIECAKQYQQVAWEKIFNCNVTDKAWGLEDTLVLDKRFGVQGIADCWCIGIDDRAKRAAGVLDYKYGRYPVKANENPQLAFLAVALQNEMRERGKDLDYVKGSIFQPRSMDGEKYTEHVFNAKSLDSWRKKFLKVIEQVYVKQKPLFKVGKHCRWCSAQGLCPLYEKQIKQELSIVFNPENDIEKSISVETLSDAQILAIWEQEERIQAFLKAIKGYIMQRAQAGNDIKGLKVVEGRTRRQWIPDLVTIKETLAALGVTECTSEKMLTLTEIEKVLIKQVGRKEAKMHIEPLVNHSRPSLSIVGENDPRPGIGAINNIFETIEEEENE